MMVVPCTAISRKREVPKSVTLRSPVSDTSMLPGPQIAVQDAGAVRVIDRVADLAAQIEGQRDVEGAVAEDLLLERLALHVLHDDEEDVVRLLGRQHGDDVGMAHRREQPRFLQQLGEVEALLVRDFERDFLVDPGVFGQVHAAEAAAASAETMRYLPMVCPRKNTCARV